jgi:glutamine synthetase
VKELAVLLEETVDYVQYQFTTILGDLKAVEFPVEIWDEMSEGTGVDGSSLGFLPTEQSDMKVTPIPGSLAILPWEPRVARLLCDITDNSDRPHPSCPRAILKRAIAEAEKMGLQYRTRPELEFYLVDEDCSPLDSGGYMETGPLDGLAPLRRSITDSMLALNLGLKTIHHENGPGQQEVELTPEEALRQADNVQTAKLAAKTEASLADAVCTFMPKPLPDEAGSGLHIHQFLTRDGANAFADRDEGVSELLRHFVGGIMEHVDAMSALLNPTTNSYKRLVPGHEAPVYKSWGVGNRTALIRIPGYERSARVEYRATDGASNIYLASALLLAAGLDGARRKTEPIPPTTENIERMTPNRRRELGITQLPASLEESIEHLQSSKFVREVLGREMIDIYADVKLRELRSHREARAQGPEAERRWEIDSYLVRS